MTSRRATAKLYGSWTPVRWVRAVGDMIEQSLTAPDVLQHCAVPIKRHGPRLMVEDTHGHRPRAHRVGC